MEVTVTLLAGPRSAWRAWLADNHRVAPEIWLLYSRGLRPPPGELTYLDAVEEALCFGWIDGIAKVHEDRRAQRFTPRRKKSNWTELNKERMRRLIAAGQMTDAGLEVAPDLDPASFRIPPAIEARLREDPAVWENFQRFPPAYQRVRIGNVAEMSRNAEEHERRLGTLLTRTRLGQMYGNWDDSGMALTE